MSANMDQSAQLKCCLKRDAQPGGIAWAGQHAMMSVWPQCKFSARIAAELSCSAWHGRLALPSLCQFLLSGKCSGLRYMHCIAVTMREQRMSPGSSARSDTVSLPWCQRSCQHPWAPRAASGFFVAELLQSRLQQKGQEPQAIGRQLLLLT